jgi:tetratricopeptide (TPR) repeat protein
MFLAPAFSLSDRAAGSVQLESSKQVVRETRVSPPGPVAGPGAAGTGATEAVATVTDVRTAEVAADRVIRGVQESRRAGPMGAGDYHDLAKAYLIKGDIQQAAEVFARAVRLDPENPGLRFEYATVLYRRFGRMTEDVERELLAAHRYIDQASPQTRREIYQTLVYLYLYRQPDGYKQAIRFGEEYVKRYREDDDPQIAFNLACAYAQEYAARKKAKASPKELDEAKARALQLLRAAVEKEPLYRTRLRELMNPPPGSEDDDFVVFKGDADFEQLASAS